MPKKLKITASKTVEALSHTEAKRKNIPTAEYQSVLKEQEKSRPALRNTLVARRCASRHER